MKNSFYTLLLVMLAVPVFGQGIKLSDLTKIELFGSNPWWAGGGMNWGEVIPEGKIWNCYHIRSQERPQLIKDSTRRLIKAIPIKDLKQMLAYINQPDTVLNFKQIKVSAGELKQYIDTLQNIAKKSMKFRRDAEDSLLVNLTAAQKAYFFKMIESKQAVKDAGLKAFHPFSNVDLSYYGMVFTRKDKQTDTVYAYVNSSHLYHLPWQIKNKQSYNQHLTELFESMLGNDEYPRREKGNLVCQIDKELFRRWVVTEDSWANYKLSHPSNYQSLSKTLTPVMTLSFFKSARLPFNIQLRFRFSIDIDTIHTSLYNKCEQEVVGLYKNGGFFFDYMRAHPTTIAFVDDVRSKNIEQVKAIYPDITKFDEREIKFVYTAADFYRGFDLSRRSGWLMLPDGKMILIFCSDQLIKDGDKIFADFPLTDDKKPAYFCIVYDRQGHKLASGKSPLPIKSK